MAARFTRRVYIGDTPAEAWHIHNVLDQHGIASELRNETLFGATGEIPVLESLPEVWVSDVNSVAAEQQLGARHKFAGHRVDFYGRPHREIFGYLHFESRR